jgi:hypothetical protein
MHKNGYYFLLIVCLKISLGCMLVDVAKFCFIFVLIISSFSIGLAQLYWYYDPGTPVCMSLDPETCKLASNAFSSYVFFNINVF